MLFVWTGAGVFPREWVGKACGFVFGNNGCHCCKMWCNCCCCCCCCSFVDILSIISSVQYSNWPPIFVARSREAMKSVAAIASRVLGHLDQKGKVMAEYIWLHDASSTGGFDMRGKTMSLVDPLRTSTTCPRFSLRIIASPSTT